MSPKDKKRINQLWANAKRLGTMRYRAARAGNMDEAKRLWVLENAAWARVGL